jgi:uncharacterized membrane protein
MRDESDGPLAGRKRPLLYAMSAVYVVAGVAHFLAPRQFAKAVPPSLPRPRALVYLSGFAEVVLGVGVLFERTRRESAWGIVALLVAVFPANVHMATSEVATDAVPDWAERPTRLAAWARLPFQAVLVAWAWWYTKSEEE